MTTSNETHADAAPQPSTARAGRIPSKGRPKKTLEAVRLQLVELLEALDGPLMDRLALVVDDESIHEQVRLEALYALTGARKGEIRREIAGRGES